MGSELERRIIDSAVASGRSAMMARRKAGEIRSFEAIMVESRMRGARSLMAAIHKCDRQVSVYARGAEGILRDQGRFVLIDPLNGEEDYLKGRDGYCVMASYIEDGAARFGAMYFPERDELFFVSPRDGALMNGKRIGLLRPKRGLRPSVFCHFGPSSDIEAEMMVLRLMRDASLDVVQSGAVGQAMADLSRGKMDGLMLLGAGPHLVAGYLLMAGAGAAVTDIAGRPLDLRSATLLAAGSELHSHLLCQIYQDPELSYRIARMLPGR